MESKSRTFDPDSLQHVAAGLRERAEETRRWTIIILGAVLSLMLMGLFVFMRAGELAKREVSGIGRLVGELELQTDYLRAQGRRLDSLLAPKEDRPCPDAAAVKEHVEDVKGIYNSADEEITRLSGQIASAVKKLDINLEEEARNAVVLQTLTTRVGILLMIIFMLQVLLGIFRYSSRIADGLESRAAALQLLAGMRDDNGQLPELVRALAVDHVDFSRGAAKSPTEEAVELAKAILPLQRGKE